MNPLAQLELMVNTTDIIRGVIQGIEGEQFLLATASGLRQVPMESGFEIGDTVVYQDGKLTKEVKLGQQLPTIWV